MISADFSLNDAESAYRNGTCSYEELVEYLRKWNAFPGHFTQAVWSDGAIRNFDPEKSGVFYRHMKEEFGLRI